ncbi:MAG: protoheme IX farnesyltransferase [Planctomycetes bacterium]|nr:protoheme IX farnesyltransferase [Planctomycetota bacterium]
MKDYWKLLRPRIVVMVLFAMGVAACVAGEQMPPKLEIFHALLGTALVIGGAVALNQRLETRGDARMPRTAGRPLPAGRLTGRQVTAFGLLLSAAGVGYLLLASHPGVAVLAVASWVVYVWMYTPLKSVTVWQTPIGAVAGAMPVLIGAAVARSPMSPMAVSLFLVLCLWQFPHAMAIAWLYREEFARAEVKLATVVDRSGRAAGVVAVLGSVALLPVSLIPWKFDLAGWPYAVVALVLGHAYMACSFGFLHRRTDGSARRLLWASLVYLPALFAALLFL